MHYFDFFFSNAAIPPKIAKISSLHASKCVSNQGHDHQYRSTQNSKRLPNAGNSNGCAIWWKLGNLSTYLPTYIIVAVGSSGILKGKQKLGVTFNFDKLGGIDFTKFSKLTMCSA